MSEIQEQPIKRGGCLTALLILMLISNTLVSLSYLFMGDSIAETTDLPKWAMYVFVVMCILNIISVAGILRWKKWGVYGVTAVSLVTFVINLSVGITLIRSLVGLIIIVLIIIFVKPIWNHLK